MNSYTIRDLENLSGIKAHTIRIWEQRYSFLKPKRTETNIRYYSADELKTILNVSLLNKYGFKISHIDKMQPDEIGEKVLSLNSVEAQQERVVNELIQAMIDLDVDGFEGTLNRYISAKSIEKAITQIVFPFLERIGILWQTGHINPGQEHLVSNIIRQKLIAGIENTKAILTLNKTFLLFLPEGEHHELGLLYVYFLIKSRGAKVIYLGANVPVKDIEFVTTLKKPSYLYTHLTSASNKFNFEKFITALQSKLPENIIIISGQSVKSLAKPASEKVILKKSLSEVVEFVFHEK
ncbi:MAG: MerR family transcriptional regulator [Bacteroidia bacterium]|nr:MerR family transcriptional regulator [Bacteroidia bacterium]